MHSQKAAHIRSAAFLRPRILIVIAVPAVSAVFTLFSVFAASTIIDIHLCRCRIRIERKRILRIRRTVVIVVRIVGVIDAVVIVVAV